MKVFVIDPDKCVGCYSCQIVCKDEHVYNDWSPIAKPQPEVGHFWMKVHQKDRGQTPKVKVSYVVTPCMHCENAPCEKASDGAIYHREDGLVIIDPEKSKGKENLVDACPYGSIYWNEELNIPQKCTGCAHLLDDGWEVPRCVEACAHDALLFGEEEDFAELLENAEVLKPELNTKPRVFYNNLPKRFLAGQVVDTEADEVLIGAKVTLTNPETGETWTETTDDFGDFWFMQIEPADYEVTVEYDGYFTRTVKDFVSTKEEDLNVGVISMYQKA